MKCSLLIPYFILCKKSKIWNALWKFQPAAHLIGNLNHCLRYHYILIKMVLALLPCNHNLEQAPSLTAQIKKEVVPQKFQNAESRGWSYHRRHGCRQYNIIRCHSAYCTTALFHSHSNVSHSSPSAVSFMELWGYNQIVNQSPVWQRAAMALFPPLGVSRAKNMPTGNSRAVHKIFCVASWVLKLSFGL